MPSEESGWSSLGKHIFDPEMKKYEKGHIEVFGCLHMVVLAMGHSPL